MRSGMKATEPPLTEPYFATLRSRRRARRRVGLALAVGLLAIATGPLALVIYFTAQSPARRYARLAARAAALEGREAAQAWRRAAAAVPEIAQPRFNVARALATVGDLKGAQAAVREALARSPEHLEASLLAAEIAIAEGRGEEARELTAHARRRADALFDSRIAARLRFLDGRIAEAAQDRAAAAACYEEAVGLYGREVDARIALARLLERRGDRKAARGLIGVAVEAAPTRVVAPLALAALEERTGDRPAAIAATREAVRRAARSREAHLALGELCARAGDLARAVEEGEALAGLGARPEEALLRGIIALEVRSVEAASAALGDAERLASAETPAATPILARAAFLRGRIALEASDLELARGELARARDAADPTGTEARRLLARVELRAGRFEDAAREARALLDRDLEDAEARALLFGARILDGNPDVAAKDLAGLARHAGELGLRGAAVHARRLSAAAASLAAEPAAPETPETVLEDCEAVRALDTLLREEPSLALARAVRDLVATRLSAGAMPHGGFVDEVLAGRDAAFALAEGEKAIAARPRDARVFVEIAAAEEKLGRLAAARAAARHAAELTPGEAAPHALLAELIAPENVALAVVEAEMAARAAPRDRAIRALHGALLLRAGRAADAAAALDIAVELAPRDARARRLLGEALLARGGGERARDELFAALVLTPAGPERTALEALVDEAPSLAAAVCDAQAVAAPALEPGRSIAGRLEGGRARLHELRCGSARLLRLRFDAPRNGPSLLDLVLRRGAALALEKRMEIAPGESVAIDGLEPREGLLVRISTLGGADAYALALEPSREDPDTFEREPDDDLASAVPLAAGASRRGTIEPRGDVDCFCLGALPSGMLGTLGVAAPRGIAIDVRLVRESAAGLTTVRELRIAPGESTSLGRLDPGAERLYALISSPGASEEPYSLTWSASRETGAVARAVGATTEVEPNDRPEWATPVAFGGAVVGAIDRRGDVDWIRLDHEGHAPEEIYSLSVAVEPGPAVAVELVAEEGPRLRTIRSTTVAPGAPLETPRLALPAKGASFVCVTAAPGAEPLGARWRVAFGPADDLDPEAEIEPNDDWRDAMALPLGGARTGRLAPARDADWYRVAPAEGPLAIAVEGARDVERRLEIYGRTLEGGLAPILAVEVERGAPLSIDALAVPRAEIFVCLSAREASRETYRIRASPAATHDGPRAEVEPNDGGGDLALRLGPGERATGRIGWRGDRDPYAVALGAEPASLALAAPSDAPVDLEVYARDRSGALVRIAVRHADRGKTATFGPLTGRSSVLVVVSGPRTTEGFYTIEVRK